MRLMALSPVVWEEAGWVSEGMHASDLLLLSVFSFQWSLVTEAHMERIGCSQRQAPECSVLAELSTSHRGLEEVQFL